MHLTLHLTGRCNLRCRYCYAAPHREDMTLETAQAAISLARAHLQKTAPGQSLGVIFFGGEPLLRRDVIVQVMQYCREVEAESGQLFHFKITTNGLLLDETFLTDKATAEIFVALSHDGVPAAHDACRVNVAGEGTFEKLEPKIDLLLNYKPYAPVMLVVTPENVQHYAASIRYLFSRGFRYLICSLNYAGNWQRSHLKELRRQYECLADWYFEETRQEEKFYFSPFEVKITSHIFPDSCKKERCELGQRQISVAPNGRLYPCVQFVGDGSDLTYAIGEASVGLDEAARQRLYELNEAEKVECITCAIRERCNHFCGCLNKQTTGRIDQVSPVLCAHERIVLPIADALAAKLYKKKDPLFIQKHYNEFFPLVSLVEDRTAGRKV